MRILVTSSRNPFALNIVRKLATAGHQVVACDTFDGAVGSHSKYLLSHQVTASPRHATDQFISDIAAIVERFAIELILPTFEEAFYLAARVSDLPAGVRLFTGAFEQLARLHDKVSFQHLATRAGVPVPETVVATDDAGLREATSRFDHWFARAAFSRGGVGLLTNTGPLAGQVGIDDCHPSPEQPWLVQPFVSGPMVCSYSVVVDGRVIGHCTYRAPELWRKSTGITFLAVDSTQTLDHTQRFVDVLGGYSGQLSFDYVDHDGELLAIECNPRTTNGVMLMSSAQFDLALSGTATTPQVVEPGVEKQLTAAVVANLFGQRLSHLPDTVEDLFRVPDVDAGWHDHTAMLWAPAALVHGARLSHGKRQAVLAALADDIVWNGEPISGMSAADAKELEAIHAQRF
ncbi:hypothetical protein ACF3NT_04220 [Naumannella halotolerans]|uniref:hypothetical protein n=1 Tax=Naumannella halotolerans TaxID=993414 RepID=UPI00370D7456